MAAAGAQNRFWVFLARCRAASEFLFGLSGKQPEIVCEKTENWETPRARRSAAALLRAAEPKHKLLGNMMREMETGAARHQIKFAALLDVRLNPNALQRKTRPAPSVASAMSDGSGTA